VSRDDTARPAQPQAVVTMRYLLQRLHPLGRINFARFPFANTKGKSSVADGSLYLQFIASHVVPESIPE
jgi:hypothetical protein